MISFPSFLYLEDILRKIRIRPVLLLLLISSMHGSLQTHDWARIILYRLLRFTLTCFRKFPMTVMLAIFTSKIDRISNRFLTKSFRIRLPAAVLQSYPLINELKRVVMVVIVFLHIPVPILFLLYLTFDVRVDFVIPEEDNAAWAFSL